MAFKLGTKVTVTEQAPESIQGMHGTVKHWSTAQQSSVELYQGDKWIGTKRVRNNWIIAV